jgi:hypothetical protein
MGERLLSRRNRLIVARHEVPCPGGTYESSPAIYRRVRDHMGPRPGGTPEYRCAINSKVIVLQSRYRVSLEN